MNARDTFIVTILTLLVAGGSHPALAQDSTRTFVPVLSYTADLVVNTCGGIKTGAVYQGYAVAGVEINPWKNGCFRFTVGSTHGGEPTGTLVGDWQEMDNIESGNHIMPLDAWYSHTINKVTIKAGLQSGDDNYSVFAAANNLQNTAFGGNAVFMSGGNVPTMPTSGLGVTAEWQISDATSWQAGVFGHIIELNQDNDFCIKHKLSDNGYLFVTEGQFTPTQALVLTAGAYYHTDNDNYGFYAACEKSFHLQGNRAVNTFVTGGYAPRAIDAATASITCGASLTSVFSKGGADALTAGLATAHLNGHRWEKAIELNYNYQLNDHFYVSPDVQWILDPIGVEDAKNALVCTLRLGFEL